MDDYLSVADAFEADVDQLESDAFDPDTGIDIQQVSQLKRELREFRRAVIPLTRPSDRLA